MVPFAFQTTDRRHFVAGLVDWLGTEPPTAESIAGRAVLPQAKAHIDAIAKTGGAVLGMRALELDHLEPIDPVDYRVGAVHRVWGCANNREPRRNTRARRTSELKHSPRVGSGPLRTSIGSGRAAGATATEPRTHKPAFAGFLTSG